MKEDHANMPGMGGTAKKPEPVKPAPSPQKAPEPKKTDATPQPAKKTSSA